MNALFSLIHSLSPSEKRYFKLFTQRQVQHKNTNYAKLFDAINEQEVYNEEALLKKFRKEVFVKQFGVAKNYLFNMILSCMQQYNEENFIEWKIRNMFLQIKILASKGLDVEGVLPSTVIKQRADIYVNALYMKQEPPVSFNAKYRYYATWSLYYNLINDQQRNYECCKKGVLIREEQITHQPLLNMDPLASYYNFLLSCEKADRWNEFELYLDKIYNFDAPTIEVNIRRMHNYCWCGLMYYLKAYEIIGEYKRFFVDKKIGFRKDFKIYIEACCGLVCLFLNKYKEAMSWWNDLLNKPIAQVELRSQASLRLYLIMLHYDENNFDIIEYVSKQAKKYLEQISLFHEPERLFLKSMNDIVNTMNKKDRVIKLTKLHAQLSQMPLSISGNAVNIFVINWIKAKL